MEHSTKLKNRYVLRLETLPNYKSLEVNASGWLMKIYCRYLIITYTLCISCRNYIWLTNWLLIGAKPRHVLIWYGIDLLVAFCWWPVSAWFGYCFSRYKALPKDVVDNRGAMNRFYHRTNNSSQLISGVGSLLRWLKLVTFWTF